MSNQEKYKVEISKQIKIYLFKNINTIYFPETSHLLKKKKELILFLKKLFNILLSIKGDIRYESIHYPKREKINHDTILTQSENRTLAMMIQPFTLIRVNKIKLIEKLPKYWCANTMEQYVVPLIQNLNLFLFKK